MFTYTWRCKNKHEFETTNLKPNQKPLKCPHCKSRQITKIIVSAPTVQFKGSGFYINDKDKK